MPRPRLYVETSVVNGSFSKDARISRVSSFFWNRVESGIIEAHISSYVLFELNKTMNDDRRGHLLDVASLCVADSPSGGRVEELAEEYVRRGMIPKQYVFDAYHIASACLGRFDALVTWNFEHILKQKTELLLEIINKEKNIHFTMIKNPEEYIW